MPWKESSVMDERIRFVIRLKDGETMACLCREFGISRKTGYKIFERYEECGLEGLTDRARRPHVASIPPQVRLDGLDVALGAEVELEPVGGVRRADGRPPVTRVVRQRDPRVGRLGGRRGGLRGAP